ncbi:MAG TPA: PH domain-containing protein [Cytophagaceae bacterium]|jgi:hypothetical protein|nr:PH domain-containing protein [Cytophagaceae bacterium]
MTTTTYPTKIGIELVVPIVVVFGISSAFLIYEKAWIGLLINMTAVTGISYVFTSMTYTVEGDTLCINSALMSELNIDIKSIQRIQETRDPVSSPAASIDRLEILYGQSDRVLISPKCKKEFIRQLKAINPEIEIVLRNEIAYN